MGFPVHFLLCGCVTSKGHCQCHTLPPPFCELLAGNPRLAHHTIHCTLCKTLKRLLQDNQRGKKIDMFFQNLITE